MHCGVEETDSAGIIYIICHAVFRHPSEYGTCSMYKSFLTKGHMERSSKLIELEVTQMTSSMVDKRYFATLKTPARQQTSWQSSQSNFVFNI
jgi:hypothetical protein